MQFRHETIDPDPPAGRLANCLTTDLTGNGLPDVIVTALGADLGSIGPGAASLLRVPGMDLLLGALYRRFETNVFWYENPGWQRHTLAPERDLHLGVGATLADLSGSGRLDLIVGQGFDRPNVYWYEQPSDPRTSWKQHLLTDRFQKYHDLAVGDIDDDGADELVGLSQDAETIFYYDIPDDPTTTPWPESHLHIVAEGLRVEGVEILDIDGDGHTELLAGTSIFHQPTGPGEGWRREDIATGWDDTRVVTADLDGDGAIDVVLAEGDSPTFGTHPARLAWFGGPAWDATFLKDDLFCPHSLEIADFTGDGRPDIFVGEMGLGSNDDPQLLVYLNQGAGRFEERVIDRGIPTHQARVVDVDGNGRPDIVGKSYGPECHVDVWYNEG